ncbi:MAG: hypothetical protein AAF363_15680 [Bacteroidota bacterium]
MNKNLKTILDEELDNRWEEISVKPFRNIFGEIIESAYHIYDSTKTNNKNPDYADEVSVLKNGLILILKNGNIVHFYGEGQFQIDFVGNKT